MMEILSIVELIQEVFSNVHVYRSLVVYDPDVQSEAQINHLLETLRNDDFPVLHTKDDVIPWNENEDAYTSQDHRMFLMPVKAIRTILQDVNAVSNISVVFCLSSIILKEVSAILDMSGHKGHELHLFSC